MLCPGIFQITPLPYCSGPNLVGENTRSPRSYSPSKDYKYKRRSFFGPAYAAGTCRVASSRDTIGGNGFSRWVEGQKPTAIREVALSLWLLQDRFRNPGPRLRASAYQLRYSRTLVRLERFWLPRTGVAENSVTDHDERLLKLMQYFSLCLFVHYHVAE